MIFNGQLAPLPSPFRTNPVSGAVEMQFIPPWHVPFDRDNSTLGIQATTDRRFLKTLNNYIVNRRIEEGFERSEPIAGEVGTPKVL